VLNGAATGWLVKDTLVLKAAVTVEREDRFQLDTGVFLVRNKFCLCTPVPAHGACVLHMHAGGIPCDVTLKLPCGAEVLAVSHLLKMASPVLRDLLEDVTGSAPIPVSGMRTYALPVVCRTVAVVV
jgi:hypothetical protein